MINWSSGEKTKLLVVILLASTGLGPVGMQDYLGTG